MNKDDLILISVDDHIAEPADMFDAHVPAKYKEFAPRVVNEPDGIQQWYYGEVRGRNMGLNAVAGKPREMYNIDASRYDEMRPGCFNVDERVRDMNAGGQLAGLNFPNFTGFSGQVLNQGPDRDVNLVMIKAYNDWHVDEWCGAYPGRFIPCGILPLYDVAEAAKEVKRLADKGCHAVTFSENPRSFGDAQHSHQILVSVVRGRVRKQDGAVHPCRLRVAISASVDGRPAQCADDGVLDDEHVHLHRADLGRVLGRLPATEVLAHRGRRRLDTVLRVAGRACL